MAQHFDHVEIHSEPHRRSEAEERWVSFQPYLLSKGYRLRARYQPDWTPSWTDADDPLDFEDSLDCIPIRVLDAARIVDEQQVKIKMVVPANDNEGKDECALLQYFSTPSLRSDPSNHVVPCLDSFPIPGVESGYFVVMPLLSRYRNLPFYNLAEVHDLLQQLFEGLLFMHRNNVAHRDIAPPNLMMDARPLFDEPFHPFYQTHSIDAKRRIRPRYRRSQKGIRYYYIDLGYAAWFQDTSSPRMVVGMSAREAAPEQIASAPYNPFLADVYQLGAMIHRDLIQKIEGIEFLLPLAQDMTKDKPNERPALEGARNTMNTAFLGLSGWKYRRPFVPKDATFQDRCRIMFVALSEEANYWLMAVLNFVLRRKQTKVITK